MLQGCFLFLLGFWAPKGPKEVAKGSHRVLQVQRAALRSFPIVALLCDRTAMCVGTG